MSRQRVSGIVLSFVLLLFVGTMFFNCAKSVPSDINQQASVSSVTPTLAQATALSAEVSPPVITTDEGATILTTGGTPPYTFTLVSGSANLTSSGAILPPVSVGSVVVLVTDKNQQSVQVALTSTAPVVASPGSSPAPAPTNAPCNLPWGGQIQSGEQRTAFKASQLACPSTDTCQSEIRLCTNGQLSGSFTAQACTRFPCVLKETKFATGQNSGFALCQASVHNGNLTYGYTQISYPSDLPASCPDSLYHRDLYCYANVQSSGGNNNNTTFDFRLYSCVGPFENITPVQTF